MAADKFEDTLSSYKDELARQGMHPQAVAAYERALRDFLAKSPGVLNLDEPGCRSTIEDYLENHEVAYDDFIVQASIRKWHLIRFGATIGKHRDKPSDFRRGDDIDAEIEALRARLEENQISEGTIGATCRASAMFLGWAFPDQPVDIGLVDGFSIIEFLTQRKSHLSIGGMKTEATRLKRYLRFVDERLGRQAESLPVNPPNWGNSPLPRSLGNDEYDALVAFDGSGRSLAVAAAAALMGNLGMRCCEVAALTLPDIDFRNATVLVRATKGEADRRLPLDAETGERIARYVTGARPRGNSDNLFIRAKSHRGEPMTKSQLRGLMRYQARLAGITDFGTHMLRRRSASRMVQSGTPLKVVADILGHQSAQTTKEYLRIDVEHLRAAAGEWPGDANG